MFINDIDYFTIIIGTEPRIIKALMKELSVVQTNESIKVLNLLPMI